MTRIWEDPCPRCGKDGHDWNMCPTVTAPEAEGREPKVDITKPHWKCICGTVAMPLEDETICGCSDIYEQDWGYVDPRREESK